MGFCMLYRKPKNYVKNGKTYKSDENKHSVSITSDKNIKYIVTYNKNIGDKFEFIIKIVDYNKKEIKQFKNEKFFNIEKESSFYVDDDEICMIMLVKTERGNVRIGIDAPYSWKILRTELKNY